MRRILIGAAVALLSFLIGVSVAMLKLKPEPKCAEGGASQPAVGRDGLVQPVDFAEVFRGFDFAGRRDVRDESGSCPFGEADAWPLPEVMETSRTYVFHRRDSGASDAAFDAIQERLESVGIATKASGVNITGGRVHTDFLLFQGRGYVGNVGRREHRAASRGAGRITVGEVSDYVLTFVRP
jgi:hypothetical protein